jgi:iron complex outermembrane receptor protein
VLTATPSVGKGRLNLSFAASFNKTEIDGKVQGLSKNTNGAFDRFILDRRDSGRIVVGNPRDKYVANLGYSISRFSTNIRFVRYGKVLGLNSVNPAFDEKLGSKIVTDFTVSYNVLKELQLTLGANNIFDVYPDKVQYASNSNEGRYVFPVIATQFGYFGRYIFANLTLRL